MDTNESDRQLACTSSRSLLSLPILRTDVAREIQTIHLRAVFSLKQFSRMSENVGVIYQTGAEKFLLQVILHEFGDDSLARIDWDSGGVVVVVVVVASFKSKTLEALDEGGSRRGCNFSPSICLK